MDIRRLGFLGVAILIALPGMAMAAHEGISLSAPTTQTSCGDTVADLICAAGDVLFGPGGLLPTGTQAIDWAQRVLVDVIFFISPMGGLL